MFKYELGEIVEGYKSQFRVISRTEGLYISKNFYEVINLTTGQKFAAFEDEFTSGNFENDV